MANIDEAAAEQVKESKSSLGRIAASLDAAALQAVPACECISSAALLMGRRMDGVELQIATVREVYDAEPQPFHWAKLPDPTMHFTVAAYADVTVRTQEKETSHSLWYSDAHGPFHWCEVAFKPSPASPQRVARQPSKEAYQALSKTGAAYGHMQGVSIYDGSTKGGKEALCPVNEQEFVTRWANLFKEAANPTVG